jgi:hypothetical protein
MVRYYMMLTQSYDCEFTNQENAVVYIISRSLHSRLEDPGLIGDRLWLEVYRGPWFEDDRLYDYQQYARDVARTWNAVCLAVEVLDVSKECPPLVMADALDECGECRLGEFLRRAYSPECYGLRPRSVYPVKPRLPAGWPDHSCIIV